MDEETSHNCLNPPPEDILPLRSPHSSSYLDLNGDCLSDLFIQSHDPDLNHTYFEIWIRDDDNGPKYCLKYFEKVDPSVSQISFGDFSK